VVRDDISHAPFGSLLNLARDNAYEVAADLRHLSPRGILVWQINAVNVRLRRAKRTCIDQLFMAVPAAHRAFWEKCAAANGLILE
jgi:hypothetical protein